MPSYLFQPIATENLGAMNDSGYEFIRALISGDVLETKHLFQRFPVADQRFYSVLLHYSFSLSSIMINSNLSCFIVTAFDPLDTKSNLTIIIYYCRLIAFTRYLYYHGYFNILIITISHTIIITDYHSLFLIIMTKQLDLSYKLM